MPQEDLYKKLQKIVDSTYTQPEPQDTTTVEPQPVENPEPTTNRLNDYSKAFTGGLQSGLDSFGKSYDQLGRNNVASGLNALLGVSHTLFSPISGAFGVGSELSQDIFGKGARSNLDALLNLPVTALQEGSKLIEKGFKGIGLDISDKALGISNETSQASNDLIGLVTTIMGFKALHKGTQAIKPKVPTMEGKINAREQRRIEGLAKRGKATVDPEIRIIPKDRLEQARQRIKLNKEQPQTLNIDKSTLKDLPTLERDASGNIVKPTTESTIKPILKASEGGVVNNTKVKEGKIDPKVIENNVIESTKAEQVKSVREETTKKAPNEIEGNKSKKTARSNSEIPITPTNGEGIRSGITYKEPKVENKSTQLDREMLKYEEDKTSSAKKIFNNLEKQAEQIEWESVFSKPLTEVNRVLNDLARKEKEKPDGYGAFIEKSDIRDSRNVVERYSKPEGLTDQQIIKDFTDALRGRPTTWYADGLKLRESILEAKRRGISLEKLKSKAEEVYTKAGYDEVAARETVSGLMNEVVIKNKNSKATEVAKEQMVQKEVVGNAKNIENDIRGFIKDRQINEAILKDCNLSKGMCDSVAQDLVDYFNSRGIQSEVLEGIGLKKELGSGAHPEWAKYDRKYLGHVVAKVGNKVIDLTGSQYGEGFSGIRIMSEKEFASEWSTVKNRGKKLFQNQKEAIKEPISVEVQGQEFKGTSHLNAYKKAHEVLNKDMKFDEFMDKVVQKEVNDRIVERNNKKIEEIKEKHQIIKPDAYKQAQENIKKNLGKLNAGLDPTILKDYATVGMYHLEGGYRTFKSWAKKMNDEFGDEINPYLRDIYKSMHKDYAKEIRQFRARTPLPTPEKRGTTKGYNEDKMLSGNEDVIPELQKLGSKFDEIRNVTLTNEQSVKAGREYAKELTDSKVMDLQPGTTKNAVEATGLRIYTETRFQKANENYKQALKSGDEQAKADAFREFNKTALMYAKVRGVGSSVAQATQSFNIKMDTAIDKSIKDYINAARERGLNELADKLQSEINKVPQGATWKDKVSYVFYNILLSNPLTQVANLGGNATHFTTEIISRVIDPATNKKALLKGLRSGLKSGLKEMKEIYTQEKSIEDSKFLAGVQFDLYPKSKLGKFGRALVPTTELAMVDGFFRGVARGMETENVKTSLSKRFNESMKDVEKNIQEVLKDPFTDSKKLQEYAKELEQIERYVDYMVFQTPLKSPLGKAISKSLVMRPIIPFARVPANIIKVGLDWSPGGFVRLLGKKGKELTPKERQHIIRRAMVGTMFSMGIMKGITDGRIEVTGQGPEDSRDRELWEKSGYKPNHIYINGTGYSYQNINPWNIQLALIGNLSDLLKYDTKYFQDKDKDIVEKVGKVTLGFASTLTDQTFLQGLSSIFQAMTYQDGKYFSRLATSLGTPNILSFPKNVREYWEDKKYSYRADNVTEMFKRKIGDTEGLIPRRTVLGGDIRESGFERFVFNPTSLKSDEDSKIAKYFLDSGLRISSLQRDKNMTAEEFDKYQQKAGELVWDMIKGNLDKIKKLREKDIEKAQDYIDRRVQERKRAAKIKIKRSK